jgi:hypothetical protein
LLTQVASSERRRRIDHLGDRIAARWRRSVARNLADEPAIAMARRLLVSCSTMSKETFQTLSTQELATVGGGLGGWFANRFPVAAAGLRRFAFGRGANAGGNSGGGGCSGCSG